MLIVLLEPYFIKTNHYYLFKYFYAIARIIMTLNDSEAPVCYFSNQKASHITLSMFILTLQDSDEETDKILGKLFICLAMKSCSLDPINKIQLNKDFLQFASSKCSLYSTKYTLTSSQGRSTDSNNIYRTHSQETYPEDERK